jgi:hypothetical protein
MSHSSQPVYYDSHTLFIKCECASADQIRQAFSEALTTYQSKTNTHIDCRFRVNLVENRQGESFGISFVFVTNSAVYHMLLSKNPDGSDRVEYRDDPSWSPPSDGDTVNDAGWSTISAPIYTRNMDWAEMMDKEVEYENNLQKEKARHMRPKIPFPLEPLMTLPPYHLTPEQIEAKRSKIISDNEGKPGFDPSLVVIPTTAHFSVDRAMVTSVDSKFMPNILKCKDVPDWITKDDLKIQFSPYASYSTTPRERYIKGRRVEETYPFVNINSDRVAFVIFDPSTRDAQFALHMMKKTTIKGKSPNGSTLTSTLIFGHSYRTDRDVMADISQQPLPATRYNKSHHPPKPVTSRLSNQHLNNKDKSSWRRDPRRTAPSTVVTRSPSSKEHLSTGRFDILAHSPNN